MSQSPEIASVAKLLQEAAQTLLRLVPQDEAESHQGEPEEDAEQDEYRTYRVPFHVLDDEQELLEEYNTDRLTHVLSEIHTDLSLMVELLKGYAEGKDYEGFTYFLFAQKIQQPLDRLSKACSVTVDWDLMKREAIKAEA